MMNMMSRQRKGDSGEEGGGVFGILYGGEDTGSGLMWIIGSMDLWAIGRREMNMRYEVE